MALDHPLQREDDPDEPSPMDAVIDQTKAGNFSLFQRLSAIDQAKIIRRLKDRIAVQDMPDDSRALAIGKLLVRMQAEQPLHDLIVALSKESFGINREIFVTFNALSFMKSKAAVRVLTAFLYDKDDLAFQEEYQQLAAMDDKNRDAYIDAHPKMRTILGQCTFISNIESAEYALFRMNILGAPKMDTLLGMKAEDVKLWRDWWETNKDKFEGNGRLPKEK